MARRTKKENPSAGATIGVALGVAAAAAGLTYVVLRTKYTNEVVQFCMGEMGLPSQGSGTIPVRRAIERRARQLL